MAARAIDCAIRLFVIAFSLFEAGCDKQSSERVLPDPTETQSVSIVLYDEFGDKVISQGIVNDDRTIKEIYDCLTPYEQYERAKDLIRPAPLTGKLGFSGPRGTTWVEFGAFIGKNPLCFRVGEHGYYRGGPNYEGYQADHKRLYNSDSESIDEGLELHRKLAEICKKLDDVH